MILPEANGPVFKFHIRYMFEYSPVRFADVEKTFTAEAADINMPIPEKIANTEIQLFILLALCRIVNKFRVTIVLKRF